MTFTLKFSRIAEVTHKSNLVAGVAQVVERRIGSAEVTGPTPVASLYKLRKKTSHFLIGLFLDYYLTNAFNYDINNTVR